MTAFQTPLDGDAFDFSEEFDSWMLKGEGIDLLVSGKLGVIDSEALSLADRVVGDLERYSIQGISLLDAFTKDRGKWVLRTVDVGTGALMNQCSFQLVYDFEKTANRFEYTYVTFTVCFEDDGREILPVKFVVSFD